MGAEQELAPPSHHRGDEHAREGRSVGREGVAAGREGGHDRVVARQAEMDEAELALVGDVRRAPLHHDAAAERRGGGRGLLRRPAEPMRHDGHALAGQDREALRLVEKTRLLCLRLVVSAL